MTQNQIKKIAQQQAKMKQDGATFIMLSGMTLVAMSCIAFLNNTVNMDWIVILLFGFIISLFGYVSSKD